MNSPASCARATPECSISRSRSRIAPRPARRSTSACRLPIATRTASWRSCANSSSASSCLRRRSGSVSLADQFAMPAALQADLAHGSPAAERGSLSYDRPDCGAARSEAGARIAAGRRSSARSELGGGAATRRSATRCNSPSARSGCCRNRSRCSCRSCRRSWQVPNASKAAGGTPAICSATTTSCT